MWRAASTAFCCTVGNEQELAGFDEAFILQSTVFGDSNTEESRTK
jgi:hypothetical protein